MDDLRVLKQRADDLARRIDTLPAPPVNLSKRLCQVVNLGAIPTATGHYFAAKPARLGGAEVEGGAATTALEDDPIFVKVVGPRVPVAGDWIVAKPVPGQRWAAQMAGTCSSGTGNRLTFTGLGCPLPGTITFTLRDGLGNVIGSCVAPPTNWIDGVHPGTYTVTGVSSAGAPDGSTTFTYVSPCAGRNVVVPIGCLTLPTTITYTGDLPYAAGFETPLSGAVFTYQALPSDLSGPGSAVTFCEAFTDTHIWCTDPMTNSNGVSVRFVLSFLGCTAVVTQYHLVASGGCAWNNGGGILAVLGTLGTPTTATRVGTCFPFQISDTAHATAPFVYSMTGDQSVDPITVPTNFTFGNPVTTPCPP